MECECVADHSSGECMVSRPFQQACRCAWQRNNRKSRVSRSFAEPLRAVCASPQPMKTTTPATKLSFRMRMQPSPGSHPRLLTQMPASLARSYEGPPQERRDATFCVVTSAVTNLDLGHRFPSLGAWLSVRKGREKSLSRGVQCKHTVHVPARAVKHTVLGIAGPLPLLAPFQRQEHPHTPCASRPVTQRC